jgi:LmbE family N-acetylglucosaminyl deacetylase
MSAAGLTDAGLSDAAPGGVVVVSPHLDDAVLSAAVQLMRPGARVVTVCAGAPPAGTPLGYWDRLTGANDVEVRLRERLAEDDEALRTLGVVETQRLRFLDGQHLDDWSGRASTEEMAAELRPHLADAAEVWTPAGIGCHPDHLAVRDATLAAVGSAAPIHLYADVPYSIRYGWPASVTSNGAGSPYLDVEVWLAEELASTGLDSELLIRTVHRLDGDVQRRKVAAMACYATQIPSLDYGSVLADGDPAVIGFEVSWTRR